MAKLTKAQIRDHDSAVALLKKDVLNEVDREFVYAHWHEAAEHMNAKHGAFFTPLSLASTFADNIPGRNIIDVCAGIGILSYAFLQHTACYSNPISLTCVDINPDYVEIGKKLLPEAKWYVGDVFDQQFLQSLGRFDTVISNPPYGTNQKQKHLKYQNSIWPYQVIEAGMSVANEGTFLIPQILCPFQYSGRNFYETQKCPRYEQFNEQTGINLRCNNGYDTSVFAEDWKYNVPTVEIVYAEHPEQEAVSGRPTQHTEQYSLFAA